MLKWMRALCNDGRGIFKWHIVRAMAFSPGAFDIKQDRLLSAFTILLQ